MRVDVVEYTGAEATTTADTLYVTLQSGSEEFTECQVAESAPFGGATGSYKKLRERFAFTYERSQPSTYTWSNVEFIQANDEAWLARLKQDQKLDYKWWFQGGDGAATFGSSGNQFNLTSTQNKFLRGYLTTLCTQADVEALALSHLQGRLRFSEEQATDEVTSHAMSSDALWDRIYSVSAIMSAKLGRVYAVPLRLGRDVDRRLLAEYAAKEVLVQVLTQLHMVGGNRGLIELVNGWRTEIAAFFAQPDGLDSEERRMSGGSFRVERA